MTSQEFNKGLTDKEIDLFVQALLLPPPFGFSKVEKKQILDWLKTSSVFVKMAKRRITPANTDAKRQFFQYEDQRLD